jgi:hypothetical protein
MANDLDLSYLGLSCLTAYDSSKDEMILQSLKEARENGEDCWTQQVLTGTLEAMLLLRTYSCSTSPQSAKQGLLQLLEIAHDTTLKTR